MKELKHGINIQIHIHLHIKKDIIILDDADVNACSYRRAAARKPARPAKELRPARLAPASTGLLELCAGGGGALYEMESVELGTG